MVTHEHDIAAYGTRLIRFVDGRVENDERNPHPTLASGAPALAGGAA
jgi:putative ABC transport system ATP-binding protein